MVTWVNTVGRDSTLSAYSAGQRKFVRPEPEYLGQEPGGGSNYTNNPAGPLKFTSPGTVDLGGQGITRIQYNVLNSTLKAVIFLKYTIEEQIADGEGDSQLYAGMFIVPASAFAAGVVPTPSQILSKGSAVMVYRSWSYIAESEWPGEIEGPKPLDLEPNTKYWVLCCPTRVRKRTSSPSLANDVPRGNVNTLGRAISIWTNRTPAAPVITGPVNNQTVLGGTNVTLTYVDTDPDAVTGTDIRDRDSSGVQIQYAPKPTPTNPSPAWTDLPIRDTSTTALGKGWWIESAATNKATDGAKNFHLNRSLSIRCGGSTPGAGQGLLPTGDWQIRIRTFDWGHPYPSTTGASPRPANRSTTDYTPSNFPSSNRSPWSAVLNISIPSQIPPAIPSSPVGNIAVSGGQPINFMWLYRNTSSANFAQKARTIQVRRVGVEAWTTVVSGNSAAASYSVTDPVLFVEGFQYEWRVQTTDTDNQVADWSQTATFWVVPAPVSGVVRDVPAGTAGDATLGCGTYTAVIFKRGGKRRVGVIGKVSGLDWNRVRDDISTAKVVVSEWDIDCGNLLANLQCWAYELVLYRDNGFSHDRVWEGPITLLTYEKDSVTIHAKDVMAYPYRRILKQAMNDSRNGDTVISRATRVIQNVLAPDDPNVLPYLTPMVRQDDAKQYRNTPAYSRTAFEEVDDMAANSGLDYTAVGRSILLWGTKHRIGTLPEFRDEDLGSPPIVSEYGMSMANVYSVSDGNGLHGEADRLDANGKDPLYGLVEMLSSSWASDSPEDTGTYTQEGRETIVKSFQEYAERSIADRYPPPVVVRVPDNTTLNPDTVLSIQQLVPGVVIPLRSQGTLRKVKANQKLDKVQVTFENGRERIAVTMSPFSRDDNAVVEAE